MIEKDASFATQNEKAKSEIVVQIARIVRKHGLSYEDWRYVAKQVRKECDLRPAKKGRRLPRIGFFETFFSTTEGKVHFLRMTLAHPCYGDPAWTYSDVERALQSWLRENDVLAKYEARLIAETEAAERAVLARFQVKYGTGTK